jgi:REP element-mobilizing transposase RayT
MSAAEMRRRFADRTARIPSRSAPQRFPLAQVRKARALPPSMPAKTQILSLELVRKLGERYIGLIKVRGLVVVASETSSRARAVESARQRGSRRVKGATQLCLPIPAQWGGRRRGAGRPAAPGRGRVAHRRRPAHRTEQPVHVTLRSVCRSLRTQFVFPTVRAAIHAANRVASEQFRVVHFPIQADHLHLIVEARDRASLLAGVRGFCIRLAKRVNSCSVVAGDLLPIAGMGERSKVRERFETRWSTCSRTFGSMARARELWSTSILRRSILRNSSSSLDALPSNGSQRFCRVR